MSLRVLLLSMMLAVVGLMGCSGRDVVARELTERGSFVVGVNERGTELAVFPENFRDQRVAAMQRLLNDGRPEGWYVVALATDGSALAAIMQRMPWKASEHRIAIALSYRDWATRIDITNLLNQDQRSQVDWSPLKIWLRQPGVFCFPHWREELTAEVVLQPWPTDADFARSVVASVRSVGSSPVGGPPPERTRLWNNGIRIDQSLQDKFAIFGHRQPWVTVQTFAGPRECDLDMSWTVLPVVLGRQN